MLALSVDTLVNFVEEQVFPMIIQAILNLSVSDEQKKSGGTLDSAVLSY